MLKGHRACIDLEKNVLRIQGREVSFLSEHELPEKARDLKEFAVEGDESAPSVSNPSSSISRQRDTAPTSFPGGGRTLGSAPTSSSSTENQQGSNQSQPMSSTRHLEQKIQILMDLGATREIAISSLDAAGGDVDVAASLLF
jgi:DNA damage-inducible protein 1